MSHLNRRQFLNHSMVAAGIGAGFAIGGTKSSGRVIGANDTVRIGVAGLNGRGGAHVGEFSGMKGVEITYLIDPDTTTYAKRIKQIAQERRQHPARRCKDVRHALDDQNLDADLGRHAQPLALADHHLGLPGGQGRLRREAVQPQRPRRPHRRRGRAEVRPDRPARHPEPEHPRRGPEVAELVKSGRYGKLLVSRGLCYKPRKSIGVKPNTEAPASIDYNLWLGPALEHAFNANYVHYNWHWFWDFGNGDIGNQGVHQMDIARWMIPGATLPKSVVSLGGRFGYTDQGETPNSQIAVYGLRRRATDLRGPRPQDRRVPRPEGRQHRPPRRGDDRPRQASSIPRGRTRGRAAAKGRGRARAGRGGHFGNFIAAVRSQKTSDLNADILEGHYSSALCHLANISYRLGEQVPFNTQTKAFGDNKDAYETLERMEEYLTEDNGLKLDGLDYRLGRKLTVDAEGGDVRRRPRGQQAADPPLPQAVRRARVALLSVCRDRRADSSNQHNSPISRSQVEREMGERATGSNDHESAQILASRSPCACWPPPLPRGPGRREAAPALLRQHGAPAGDVGPGLGTADDGETSHRQDPGPGGPGDRQGRQVDGPAQGAEGRRDRTR